MIAEATTIAPTPPRTTMEVLRQMEARAGVAFAGEVVGIRIEGIDPAANPLRASSPDGVVEVSLRVDDAIRGCSPGQTYVLREWFALWMNQPGRYRLGQRAVWMLYPPNAGGLSSPVGGMMGILPISGRGDRTQVDLRWAQTRLLRSLPSTRPSDAVATTISDPEAATTADPPQLAYRTLMDAMRTMEASNHAAQ